jgi:hypothetical protein
MDPKQALRDIKPIYELTDPINWLWLLGTIILIAIAVATIRWWLKKRANKPQEQPATPQIHPYQWLQNELSQLENLDAREFCFRLSFIFREYVERQFNFPATDRTSEEILTQLRTHYIFANTEIQSIRQLFDIVDPVKYADQLPKADDTDKARQLVVGLANNHKPAAPNQEQQTK